MRKPVFFLLKSELETVLYWIPLCSRRCAACVRDSRRLEWCRVIVSPARLAGCQGMWDAITCWPSARVGEVVTITCPTYFSYFNDHHRGKRSLPQCMSMSAALQNDTIFRCRKIIRASVFMKKKINNFWFNSSSFFLSFFPMLRYIGGEQTFGFWLRASVDIQRFTSCLRVFWYLKKIFAYSRAWGRGRGWNVFIKTEHQSHWAGGFNIILRGQARVISNGPESPQHNS